jgi:multidrug efflux pump subunit AcrA (membrane-fusion protein)
MAFWKPTLSIIAVALAALITQLVVVHYRKPGHLDVIAAQAMDMSSIRPPVGSTSVDLTTVRRGSIDATVTYTGSVVALNEEDIASRITGRIVDMPGYPGDIVRAGQALVRLDSDEVGARADQARAEASEAQSGANAAMLMEDIHHAAALEQSQAQERAAQQELQNARAEADAAQAAIGAAQAEVRSAQSSRDYWTPELAREKSLLDAGAVSLQEYQSELSQAQAADAALAAAAAKLRQAQAGSRAATAKAAQSQSEVDAARAASQMAAADMRIGMQQAKEAQEGASASSDAARTAEVVKGYAQLRAPAGGVISERLVSPGALVQPGQVLLRVAQIDRVRVQANVAVADIAGIVPGSPVSLSAQGSPAREPIAARVTTVFPAADPQTHTDIVEAIVPNPGQRLLPGAFVTMRIAARAAGVHLLVPSESVVTMGGRSYVWIARAANGAGATEYQCQKCGMRFSAADAKRDGYKDPMDGGALLPVADAGSSTSLSAHEVDVQTGASDGNSIEILSGDLHEGDLVVRSSIAGLTEGASVKQQ